MIRCSNHLSDAANMARQVKQNGRLECASRRPTLNLQLKPKVPQGRAVWEARLEPLMPLRPGPEREPQPAVEWVAAPLVEGPRQ